MNSSTELLVFTLDGQRYALPLPVVDRIVRAAEITPLPNAPEIVLGALDLEGVILPVVSLRRRFQREERELRVTDQFLIARTGWRTVVLLMDEAQGVIEVLVDRITRAEGVVAGLPHFQGVAALEDGLVLIHDLEKLLSQDEAVALDAAILAGGAHEN